MTNTRTGLVLGAAMLVAATLAFIAFRKTDPSPTPVDRERATLADNLVKEGQKEYKTIPMADFAELGSLGAVRSLLDRMEFVSEPSTLTGGKRQLLDAVASFVYFRFVSQSIEDYNEWRRASGKELVPLEELRRLWLLEKRHQEEIGGPIPEAATEEDLFARFWDAAPEFKAGKKWPVGIAADGKGLLAACGPFDSANKSDRPSLSGTMPRELWIGAIGGTFPPWWRSIGARNGGIAPHLNKTECAEVGVIFRYSDGSRRPMVLTFLWDGKVRAWELEWVNVYNYPLSENGRLEY